jgi:glycosyltransferase involved in cell wall biosynthesis
LRILIIRKESGKHGEWQYICDLVQLLSDADHQVTVVLGNEVKGTEPLPDNIEVVLAPKIFSHFPSETQISEMLEDIRPDMIHAHAMFHGGRYHTSLLGALNSFAPTILHIHTRGVFCPKGDSVLARTNEICDFPISWRCISRCYPSLLGRHNLRNLFFMLLTFRRFVDQLNQLPLVLVASRNMRRFLVQNSVQPNKIEVLNYMTYFAKAPLSPSERLVLYVGSLSEKKGVRYLLQAIAQLEVEDFSVALVGRLSKKPWIDLASELGVQERVEFYSFLPHEDLESLYREARLTVVPSMWPEPFGIVGLEAMAFGKPVVAFDVGGVSEWLVDGKTGFLVKRGDVQALAQGMSVLLQDYEVADELGQNGQERLQELFTPGVHLKRVISLYNLALERW